MIRSVYVYGPQGCGKTRNADALKAHFKCKRVMDGVSPYSDSTQMNAMAAKVPTLFLGNEVPDHGVLVGIRVVEYAKVAKVFA